VLATDPPVIVKTKQMMAGREGVLSLAQGVVHWWVVRYRFAAVQTCPGHPLVQHGFSEKPSGPVTVFTAACSMASCGKAAAFYHSPRDRPRPEPAAAGGACSGGRGRAAARNLREQPLAARRPSAAGLRRGRLPLLSFALPAGVVIAELYMHA
jgi:hypothetical protein